MNCITGIIKPANKIKPYLLKDNIFDNGIISLNFDRTNIFHYDSKMYLFSEEDNILISAIGYYINYDQIKNENEKQKQDVFILKKLFLKHGDDFVNHLDGVFIILIYDIHKAIIKVYQSAFGADMPFYYFIQGNEIYFGTSLKKIIMHKKDREFNIEAARDFLFYEEIIPNESTLIKNIYKLVPNKILEFNINNGIIVQRKQQRHELHYNKTKAKRELLGTIENSLSSILSSLSYNPAVTHTSGWDSNFMLRTIRKRFDGLIDTATIDGGEECNEIPVVKKIQEKYYDNISHYTARVPNNLDSLSEVVWRYEGYVFEKGMLLRYELARLLKNSNIKSIILGATADQVLFPPTKIRRYARNLKENKLISLLRRLLDRKYKKKYSKNWISRKSLKRIKINKDYFDIHLDMLLKMHGIMLNSFGVQGLFPYLNKTTAAASKALGRQNKNKKYYKLQLKKLMGDNVAKYFTKSHNVVDTLKIYQNVKPAIIEFLGRKSAFVSEIIGKKAYNKISKSPEENHLLVFHCLYLSIFKELFITGKYDKFLPDKSIKIEGPGNIIQQS